MFSYYTVCVCFTYVSSFIISMYGSNGVSGKEEEEGEEDFVMLQCRVQCFDQTANIHDDNQSLTNFRKKPHVTPNSQTGYSCCF